LSGARLGTCLKRDGHMPYKIATNQPPGSCQSPVASALL